MNRALRTLTLAGFAAAGTAAQAVVTQLDFEGLQNLEPINSFYNGGTGGLGSVGPNLGVIFNNTALAVIDADAGGGGNFGGEPSPDTIMFFLDATAGGSVMTVPAGFTTGFSFFYTAINNPGSVTVYDAVNAILATQPLPLTPFNGAPDPTGAFSPLVPFGLNFAGTAFSVSFSGAANQIGFDNITFGRNDPTTIVPETSTVVSGVGLAALAGLGFARRFRRA